MDFYDMFIKLYGKQCFYHRKEMSGMTNDKMLISEGIVLLM